MWASAVMLHIPMTPSFHCTATHCTALHATAIPCLQYRCVWPCNDHFLCVSLVQWGLRQVGSAMHTPPAMHSTALHCSACQGHTMSSVSLSVTMTTFCTWCQQLSVCVTTTVGCTSRVWACLPTRHHSTVGCTSRVCACLPTPHHRIRCMPVTSDDLTTTLFSVYMWPVRIVTFCVAVLLSVCYLCMGQIHRCICFYVPSSIAAFIPLR
jgi:hypothetical protein